MKLIETLKRWLDGSQPPPPSTRWPDWARGSAPARQQLALRARNASRAHWLATTSPIAKAIADIWATSLVSDGPSIRSGHPDEAMRKALEDSFAQWSAGPVDSEGVHDLASLLHSLVASIVKAGEGLTRFDTTPRGELRIALLNPEQLDPAMSRETEDMRRIISGVEFSLTGQRVAYHLLSHAPDMVATLQGPAVRVPAEDVCHLFVAEVPGQVRGTSWLANVATRLQQLDAIEDSLAEKIHVNALFAGYFVDPSNTSGLDAAGGDPAELTMEPGTLRRLPPDATITFPDLPNNEGAPEFLRHLLRSIAAGVQLPYELMTGDLSNTNYSSAKFGGEAFKRRVKALRQTLLVSRFLTKLWERWITLEILTGRFHAPDFERDPTPYLNVSFLFPDFASLDPYRETQADIEALNAGLRSRAEIISARGRDIADVDAEISADTFQPRTQPKLKLEQTQ